jgi:polysaccharide chain length determinant protein (PEP-CTERM system associated)
MEPVEYEEERPGRPLQAARDVLSRRRWLAGLTFAGALVTVLSVVLFLPDVYRSSATVLIDRQQIPDELVRSTVTSDLEIRLHTISQEILSRSRLEALVERFGLYGDLRKKAAVEEVVERMREDISLQLLKGTDRRGGDQRGTVAFKVSYTATEPQKAALVANTLASFYIEENLKVRERQAAGTAEFLRVQLEEAKRKLEQQEQQVGRFKERNIGALPQQMEANLATLEQLNNQLRVNSESQVMLSERRAALQGQLDQVEVEGAGAPGGPRHAAERVAALNAQLTELRTRYSDKYPDVIRLKREIADLEEQRRQTDQAGVTAARPLPASPQVVQLRASVADLDARSRALQAEAATLQRTLARYQDRVENVPRTEQEYQKLARDYDTTKELYRSLLIRQSQAEVAENMEQRQKGEQFRVIEPALVSQKPTAPDRPKLIGLGLLVALALAAAAVVLAEQLDTSFHSVEDLRIHARAPVLVSIPQVVTAADVQQRRRRLGLAAAAATACLVLIVGGSYLLASADGPLAGVILRSTE